MNFQTCETENFTLSEQESTLVCSFLEDLERQICLVKFAAITSEKVTGNVVDMELLDEPMISPSNYSVKKEQDKPIFQSLKEKEALKPKLFDEALLHGPEYEYSKLEKEFGKINLRGKRPIKKKEKSLLAATLNEPSGNLEKFIANVDRILSSIKNTKRNLKRGNDFSILKEETENIFEELNRDDKLLENIEKSKERITNLQEEICKMEKEMALEEQNMVGEINRLKDECYLIKKEGEETQNVAKLYFDAKISNLESQARHELNAEKEKISKMEKLVDRDVHCLAMMEAWTEDFCEQIERKIDEWKLKLKRDEMVMEMRIEGKRRAIKGQQELMQSLNETISERLEELAPWEEEKEVERQERLAHMRRYYSCRKIQRWWRAYMIKLKLYKRRRVKPVKP